MRAHRPRSAFTLIELLVVIAIIALLISILLPSLSRAREQGKMAKCLANLRGILLTTHAYFVESNDRYPYLTTTSGICSWSYGGKSSDDYWRGRGFWTDSTKKPFNRIMVNNATLTPDEVNGNVTIRRTEYPWFKCPSDSGSTQRIFGQPGNSAASSMSTYDDIGTSYHFNIYFFIDTNQGNNFAVWERLQRDAIRDSHGNNSGRFVLYWEDPMDFALFNFVQRMGFHKVFSRHSVGFLDGHAENKLMDTRSFGGSGWVALNVNWIKRPTNDPTVFYTPVVGGFSRRNDEPPR